MKSKHRIISLIVVCMVILQALAVAGQAAQMHVSPWSVTQLSDTVIAEFQQPPQEYRAGFRYELPGGQVDRQQVARELEAIKETGFSIVEITASGVTDYTRFGLDSDAWRQTLKTIYETCNRLGMRADIHLFFNNGANLCVPGLELTDGGVTKQLVESHTDISLGASGELQAGWAVPVLGQSGAVDNPSRKLIKVLLAEIESIEEMQQIEPDITSFMGIFPSMVEVRFLSPDIISDITEYVSYDSSSNSAALTQTVSIGASGTGLASLSTNRGLRPHPMWDRNQRAKWIISARREPTHSPRTTKHMSLTMNFGN